jgi:tetratricopeptide (TPR) repeat protein
MKRGAASLTAFAILVAAFAWNTVGQDREFRRLVAAGDVALAAGRTDEAIENFSGAMALKPAAMLPYLKRGDSYRHRGDFAAALRDLRQATTIDPTAPRALEVLGDVNVELGRYERAVDAYRRFVGIDDRSATVFYKLALAEYRNAQGSQALETVRRALSLDGNLAEAHYLLALCLRDQKDVSGAARALATVVRLNPAFTPAREELADLDLAVGRTRQGLEQLEALAALDPADPRRATDVARASSRAGRFDAATTALARAAERFPDDPDVTLALGEVYLDSAEAHYQADTVRKAIKTLAPLAEAQSASTRTLTQYGRALYVAGQFAEARTILRRATATLPVDPLAFSYLAESAERLHDTATTRDALVQYVSLIDADARERVLAIRIARLSLELQQPAVALTWLQRASAGTSDIDPDIVVLRARALADLGRIDDARATIAAARAAAPNSPALRTAERQLRRR